MKAIIAPDAARTPGVAVICVYDAPGAGPADVAIYSGDGKYLSASGWQESRVSLAVDAHDDDSGCLRLQVGAAVVDNLDKLERYLFMAGDQKCVLQIKDLVYSRMQGGDGMGHAASPAAARAAARAAPRSRAGTGPHASTGPRSRTGSGAFAAAGRSAAGDGSARRGDGERKKILRQSALDHPGPRPAGPGRCRGLVVLPAGHAPAASAHGATNSGDPAGGGSAPADGTGRDGESSGGSCRGGAVATGPRASARHG